ncbi:hypothetical protein H6F61_19960 [Cyanobacteria bacterium FACHB-472]|nr:hypothetical protein [Cyanobacteria bacterium FACHB-472]
MLSPGWLIYPTGFIYQAMQTPLPIYCNPDSAEIVGASLSSINISRQIVLIGMITTPSCLDVIWHQRSLICYVNKSLWKIDWYSNRLSLAHPETCNINANIYQATFC